MHFTYRTSRVCSQVIDFDLEDGRLYNIVFTGGCNGNLKAIAKLLEGAEASFAIERLRGNRCGPRDPSCADQLAQALEKALSEA